MSSLPPQEIGCTVESAELLAASVGGARGVCAEIVRSLAVASPRPKRVEVTILSSSRARAKLVTADGKELPEMNVGSSDRALGRSSFRRLGNGLAGQLKQLKTD